MRKDAAFEAEFLIAPNFVLAIIVAIGCLIALGAELLAYPWALVSRGMSLAVVFTGIALLGALLVDWQPLVGRWFTILVLAVVVHVYGLWLDLPGALAWAAIPTAFAATLVGVPAAALTAVAESVLILCGLPYLGSYDPATVPTALVTVWAILGATVATSYGVRRQVTWFAHYFQQGQRLLEETRTHRADLMQALDDLAHVNRQLALMNQRVIALQRIAEEAQKAKTSFVARVSHEFRTPLNMIIGLTDLIVERPEIYDATLSPRMREALRIVHRNSQHLSDMVNDVLDLSRLETDHLILHRERVNLQEIITVAVEAVRPLLESKKLALAITIGEDVPSVYCDRTRIEQVVLNLVSNATRYTDAGQISIGVKRRAQYVCVSVADTGQGIAPADRERIFEPFAQGASTTWRDKGGSGLGLSISKQFIELHGGRIGVESTVGVGATFTFELPVASPLDQLDTLKQVAGPGHMIQADWLWHERRTRPKLPDSHLRPRLVVYDERGDLGAALQHYADSVELVNTQQPAAAFDALQAAPADALLLNLCSLDELHPWLGALPQASKGTPIIGCAVPRRLGLAQAHGLRGQLIKPITRKALAQALQSLETPVKRVLVVDDGPDEVALLSQMLRACDASLEIITAQDGKEALAKVYATQPDLLLLDIVMPGMNGWQVIDAMNANRTRPAPPTFFVSAQDPEEVPLRSRFMVVATEEGLALPQLLRCSLALAEILLQPTGKPDPTPE